jgi:hypothetical protein
MIGSGSEALAERDCVERPQFVELLKGVIDRRNKNEKIMEV